MVEPVREHQNLVTSVHADQDLMGQTAKMLKKEVSRFKDVAVFTNSTNYKI